MIASVAVAWVEVFRDATESARKDARSADDGSVSLGIKRAIAQVRFAARNDESIAHQANRIVRRGLDKRCISYKNYKEWRQKNPLIFTAITDDDNQLVGFFDVFPLTDDAAKGLVEGTLMERDLTIDAILPMEMNDRANKIYLASVMVNPKQTAYSPIVAKEILLLKLAEFLSSVFPPTENRMLFAYAHTIAGEKLLKNTEFKNTALSIDNKQRDPLYELSPSGYANLTKDFRALLKAHQQNPRLNSGLA